jgi:hypothetical protein
LAPTTDENILFVVLFVIDLGSEILFIVLVQIVWAGIARQCSRRR